MTNLESAVKSRDPDRPVVTNNVGVSNYRHNVSDEEGALGDAAVEEIERQRRSFDSWVCIGRAILAFRRRAEIIGGRQTFMQILEERKIAPPLDKGMISRLEKVMAHLGEVQKWRATLTEPQRIAWSSPQSVISRCPVFNADKEKHRAATPRKPTRWQSMQEENLALKKEVERYSRSAGDDCGFSRKDNPKAIAAAIVSALPEHKQRALLAELVSRVGTKKQREAFGLAGDDQPWSSIPTAGGVIA
jgi:hypothetical protein